jgi:hypothetical protein
MDYRDAAITLWGEAGAYCHDAYARLRAKHYPELPTQLPIVIGLVAFAHAHGLTRPGWEHGPRITVESRLFELGRRRVDDLLAHEMLHAWLHVTGRNGAHDGADWYAAVRRLSPGVLGHDLDVRAPERRSVRVPNPAYVPGGGAPKTLVRKVRVAREIPHRDVAGWPYAFRPEGYDWGEPIACPTY